MSDRPIYQPTRLTEEEYLQKLASDNIMAKFDAINYEIRLMEVGKFSYLRLLTYLEWFFDKVIEKKVPDKIAQIKLQQLNFDSKMKLMKKYEILIENNFYDVNLIREVRNDIAHSLLYNPEKINDKLKNLQNYSSEDFKDLDPFDKCIGIVIDIMSILTTAINTNFEFKPTKLKNISSQHKTLQDSEQ